MHPLERLIDLVALLLEARRPLTFDDIREVIPAYQQQGVSSAKRMFERDKDTLREVGIPLELDATDAWEVDQGYRIRKDQYYLPEVAFTAEEVWALFVAAHTPGETGEAEQAFQKLSAGTETNVLTAMADRTPAPGVDPSGPHMGAIAVVEGEPGQLCGRDRGHDEVRSFRLSRLLSPVKEAGEASAPPEGFDAARQLEAGPWGLGRPAERARVAFSPKVAWWAVLDVPGAEALRTRRDGWVEVDVPASQTDSFVSWILSFGPDARVYSPKPIRDEVAARLEAMASG